MDILIKNVTAATMDEKNTVLYGAYIGIKDGLIRYIGEDEPPEKARETIDGGGKLIMPGLINSHTHIPMTLFRGYADDYDLHTWLYDYIFPAEDRLDARAVKAGALLGLAEAIMTGTTSISDMYYFCDAISESVVEAGIKANISRGMTDFGKDFNFSAFQPANETRELVERWNGYNGGQIRVDCSVHAEYTSHSRLWRAAAELARENGIGMHVHLSETRGEHDSCVEKYGKTPAALFEECGIFDVRTTAAHCVWVTDEDMDILARHKVTAVHNPVSNSKLASGICPVKKLVSKGVNVALGTDGVSSNNSHDMFEEIKTAVLLGRVSSLDPLSVSKYDMLRAATVNGAKGQGREHECGRIAEGYDADLIMLDFTSPSMTPCHDALSNLAFSACGRDVCLTMVRGRILYRNGEFTGLDIEKIKREVVDYAVPKVMGSI
ncbi:MAG: amidohydrolase family protein [Oscillospiraceae bacterium]|jgi:5-methylthioadenosine/S-adenosylhomocysteine deaminase